MPELPEVETVRRGLERWILGRPLAQVDVLHPRAVRRHASGAAHFTEVLTGRTLLEARRRGKYLWFPLDSGEALLAHLGMSGQLLVQAADAAWHAHLRVRFAFADGASELHFVDQRTFGGLAVGPLDAVGVPRAVAHIAPDVFDLAFDEEVFVARLRGRRTELKRALLDQTLISGVGNIYADEALWRTRLHYARPTGTLSRGEVDRLLVALRGVLGEALGAGGTSFDALYVDVNGDSGRYSRSLDVYGRAGQPCRRCGVAIRREAFLNRSSHYCPRCQRSPRRAPV